MTETNNLHSLKVLAKRYARANRIAQHLALDLIAGELDFPHWSKLITAVKNGWRVNAQQMTDVEAFAMRALPTDLSP